jgi:AraC-like DNA-binding protein
MRDMNWIRYGTNAEGEGGPDRGRYSVELPGELSSLLLQQEYLDRGISLFWCDAKLTADFTGRFSVEQGALAFSTLLSGCAEYSLAPAPATRKNPPIRTHPCDMAFSSHDCEGTAHFYAGVPYRLVSVILPPAVLEETLSTSGLPAPFPNALLKLPKGIFFHGIAPLARQTQAAAAQILACPVTEVCRSLFLEGKALELLSLHLDRLLLHNDKRPALTKSDLERLNAARDILVKNMHDPPGIQRLSSLVGLNEFKLKNGFRGCFGDTVHGILRRERMRHARDLLRDSDTSVGIVADAVGYGNTGHFIAAFRNEFGITPGQLLKKERRRVFKARDVPRTFREA